MRPEPGKYTIVGFFCLFLNPSTLKGWLVSSPCCPVRQASWRPKFMNDMTQERSNVGVLN